MKNMAFSLTTAQVSAGRKTVTRRMGWTKLKRGELFCGIVKGMGLKKGERVQRIAILRCISNRPEGLGLLVVNPAYGRSETRKEGFPEWSGAQFAEFFCRTHKGCTLKSRPNRIAFEYVRFFP